MKNNNNKIKKKKQHRDNKVKNLCFGCERARISHKDKMECMEMKTDEHLIGPLKMFRLR